MVLPGQYVGQTLRLDQPDSVGGEIIAISDISLGTQEKTVLPRTARLGGRPHRVEIASPKILDEVKREEIRCQSPPTFLAPSIQNESDLGSGDGAMPAPS